MARYHLLSVDFPSASLLLFHAFGFPFPEPPAYGVQLFVPTFPLFPTGLRGEVLALVTQGPSVLQTPAGHSISVYTHTHQVRRLCVEPSFSMLLSHRAGSCCVNFVRFLLNLGVSQAWAHSNISTVPRSGAEHWARPLPHLRWPAAAPEVSSTLGCIKAGRECVTDP